MRTRLISLLVAASLAATAPLAPAQAQNRDAQRNALAIALGIATVAIIAKAAEAERDKARDREKDAKRALERERERLRQLEAARQQPPRMPTVITPREVTKDQRPLPRVYPRDHATYRNVVVPSSCARRVQTEGGVRTAFGAPCLRRAGVDIARLPRRCERLADVGQRDVRIWGARCLSRNGVRID